MIPANCPEILLQHEGKDTTKAILHISTAMSIQQHHLLSGSSAPSPALGTIRKCSLYRGRRMTVPVELQNISGWFPQLPPNVEVYIYAAGRNDICKSWPEGVKPAPKLIHFVTTIALFPQNQERPASIPCGILYSSQVDSRGQLSLYCLSQEVFPTPPHPDVLA
jgi:hypothetical protein